MKVMQLPAGTSAIINIYNRTNKSVLNAHCPDCKSRLGFTDFLGDFSDRGYYIGTCPKCSLNFVVVVHYRPKTNKGGSK